MFDALMKRLRGEVETPTPELDAQHALAALLVRIAKSDNHYEASEIARIDNILAARYRLNPVEAAKLRAESEKLEHDAPETGAFTELVREGVDYPERLGVFEALWQVGLADGHLTSEEDNLLHAMAPALGITPDDEARLAEIHRKEV